MYEFYTSFSTYNFKISNKKIVTTNRISQWLSITIIKYQTMYLITGNEFLRRYYIIGKIKLVNQSPHFFSPIA